jgi:hypothetical protein
VTFQIPHTFCLFSSLPRLLFFLKKKKERLPSTLFLFTLERLRKEDFEGSLYGFGISAFGA